jgi:uncharacterized protein (TIGR03905 family)
MEFEFKTRGTCSSKILFELNDDVVSNIRFIGGCNGNLQGISLLAEGMHVDALIARLQGVKCGMKSTSCPDQLAQALLAAKAK